MKFELDILSSSVVQRQSVNEIIKCNEVTQKFGLALSYQQAVQLAKTRNSLLLENGRIEFGGGVIDKIIMEFCDSSYISMNNYADTLYELLEMFYYYKNETIDLISDDDLIKFMKKSFDGACQGSTEQLYGRELARLVRNLRCGYAADYVHDDSDEDDYAEGGDGEY